MIFYELKRTRASRRLGICMLLLKSFESIYDIIMAIVKNTMETIGRIIYQNLYLLIHPKFIQKNAPKSCLRVYGMCTVIPELFGAFVFYFFCTGKHIGKRMSLTDSISYRLLWWISYCPAKEHARFRNHS